MADKNITTVNEISSVDDSDKVFVNDGNTLKQITVINLMKKAPTSSGGGTTDYNDLTNQPQLNGVTLEGNKTLDQVGVLAKNQGSNNSGKFLSVGSDGNVVPADAPSGGSVDPEQIEQAVNGYLEENPPSGMTAEQEQQLNQNTTDVADLKSALEQKGLPAGGTTGQVLAKKTNNDYDVEWKDEKTGTGLSAEAIDKLEEVGKYLVYTTADGGSKWMELISILRNSSSGGGSGETVPATGITLNKTTLSFTDSSSQTLIAVIEPSNSTDSVTWETSDAGIATVSGGVVSPVSNGFCTITAKAGSYSASCEVTVNVSGEIVTLQSISVTYTGGEVTVGTALTDLTGITVTAHYSNGSTTIITGYTLSGEIVKGKNTIIVSYGGKTTTFTVIGVAETEPESLYSEGYINDSGVLTTLADSYVGNNYIVVTGKNVGVDSYVGSDIKTVRIAEYDENYAFIERQYMSTTEGVGTFTLDDDTKYIRVGFDTNFQSIINIDSLFTNYEYQFNNHSWEDGYVDGTTGEIMTGTLGRYSSEMFDVEAGVGYTLSAHHSGLANVGIAEYKNDGAFNCRTMIATGNKVSITTKEDTTKARITFGTTEGSTYGSLVFLTKS